MRALDAIITFIGGMVLSNIIIIIILIIIGKATITTPTFVFPCVPFHYAGHRPASSSYIPQPPGQNHAR